MSVFNKHNVEYLVIGGHAVSFHAEPRGTKDLDLFIRSDAKNGEAVYRALADFGAPLSGITPADFHGHPEAVFQIGTPPSRIDILQGILGVAFEEAWKNRVESFVDKDIPAHVISRDDLIANKLAVGRGQDLVDVEKLSAAALVLPLDIKQTR
ncbi:MAG: nucleotidyltransferase [Acidobacteriaceae bacterium]